MKLKDGIMFLLFAIFLCACIFSIINIIKLSNKEIPSNALPITNKTIILDAGHGLPDARSGRL